MAALAPAATGFGGSAGAAGKWTITLAALMGALMGAIDASVVNVALVHIQGTYGVNTQEVTWVSAAYLIAVVIVMPLTAWMSALLGRKALYFGAIGLFTVASGLCGLSRTFWQLVAFRVIQGLGGGVLQPVAQAIVREAFPLEEQGQAMGFFGIIVLLGPALGPVLGGWLTDTFDWPWIFFVNLPIGPLALVLVSRFIHDPPYARRRSGVPVDGLGIGLLAVGLAALQTVLQEGERNAWFQSGFIAVTATTAAVALLSFVLWELRTPAPAADLRILANTSFASATFINGIVGAGLFGTLILLPQFLQGPLRYSATQAGLMMMPGALTMVCLMPVAGALYNRLGVHAMMSGGLLLAGLAGWLMAHYTLATGPVKLVTAQMAQGAGFAFIFVSLLTAALATIPTPLMQAATGLNNLIRQLGGSIGTTAIIALLNYKTTTASAGLVHYANDYNLVFQQWWQILQNALLARGVDPFNAHQQALAVLRGAIYQQATVVAFTYDFGLLGLVFVACLPLLTLIRRGRTQVS